MLKKHQQRHKGIALSLPRLAVFAFMLVFASVGSHLLLSGHAAAPSVQLQLQLNRGLCMDNSYSKTTNNNKVDIYACNDTMAQEWSFTNVSGGFLLVNGQGTCADDTGGGVTAGSSYVYLVSYACSSTDHNQIWKWSGAQIQNAYSKGCINDPVSSTNNGQQLIIYACGSNQPNAEWDEAAPPTPTVSVAAPTGGSTVSGSSVSISGQASVSPGTITKITLDVAGVSLGSCANATNCSASWDSTSVSNGSYTVQVTATTSGGNTGQATETIQVNNAAPPSSGGSGSSSSGSGSGSGGSSGSGTGSGSGSPSSGGGSNSGGSSSSGSGSGSGGSSGSGGVSVSKSGSGGTVSVNSSGGSGSVVVPPSTGTSGSSGVTVDQSPDTGSVTTTNNQATPNTGPTIYDIVSTTITSSSIGISWEASNASSFTVKYGPDQNNPADTRTVKSTDPQPTLTLSGLPAKTKIYVSITPQGGGETGATVSTSFTTLKATSHVGAIIGWTIFLIIVVAGAVFARKKLYEAKGGDYAYDVSVPPPTVDIQHLPVYPQEDSAAQEARVNWWLPDEQRQAIAHHQQPSQQQPQAEQYPDMFEEGRRRLEEEERQQRPPDMQ